MAEGLFYSPRFRSQRVTDDPHRRVNCAAYALATFADRATLGGVQVTGAAVRALSNEPNPDPASPGLNVGQQRDVARRLGITASSRVGAADADLLTLLRQERPVCVAVSYGALPAELRHEPGFTGPHNLYLNAISPGGSVQVYDPLASGPYWTKLATILAAAKALGRLELVYGRAVPRLDAVG